MTGAPTWYRRCSLVLDNYIFGCCGLLRSLSGDALIFHIHKFAKAMVAVSAVLVFDLVRFLH